MLQYVVNTVIGDEKGFGCGFCGPSLAGNVLGAGSCGLSLAGVGDRWVQV